MNDDSTPVFRNDGRAKVTGSALFADDYVFKNSAYAVPVFTDEVHGEILAIDTSKAENEPGVLRVITWKDVPGELTAGQINQDMPILVKDKIRFHGDVIALVVARTRKEALAASVMVTADIKPLPGLFNCADAMKFDAQVLFEEHPDNIVCHHKIRRGDASLVMNTADIIIEKKFTTPWVEHAYMEPEAATAVPHDDGSMDIYGTLQHPFSTRNFISRYLAMPFSLITCHSHAVGGSFGGKDDTASVIAARAALAAKLLHRPVKILYDREWSIRESYKRSSHELNYRYGITGDGKIVAAEIKILCDSGVYTSTTPWSTWRSCVQCCGPYAVPNVHSDVYGVITNNPPGGAFRGFGSPVVNFAVEQMMDLVAEACDLTAEEVRRKNMVVQDGLTITNQCLNNHTVSLPEVLDTAIEKSGFYKKLERSSRGNAGEDGKLYGVGLACAYRGVSVGAEAKDFSCALIAVQFDGSIILDTSVFENGQGAQSAMILLAASMLGVDPELIHYRHSTTSTIQDGGTTVASRGTLVGGGALKRAVTELKKIFASALADELGCGVDGVDELTFANNKIKGPSRSLTWAEAGKLMHFHRVYPVGFGSFQAPKVTWNEETGSGDPYFSFVYGCQVAEVEVDPEKNKIKVLKVTAVHDVGRVVNPGLARGQVYGGIVQGLGMALIENFKMEEGRVITTNLNKYKIPRTVDMPEMEAYFLETEDSCTPSGAKGIGEPAIEVISPAIANAVANATGTRCYKIPLKIEDSGNE